MKKLFAILLALVTVFAMSVTAFADETVTLNITGVAGHKYAVYQVFTGDVSVEEGTPPKKVLSNVKYGKSYGATEGEKVSDATLTTLFGSENWANILEDAVHTPIWQSTEIAGNEPIVIENLTPGYYLIKDISTELPDGHTLSPVMVEVLDDATVASKHATIVSEKKVDDMNDSTITEVGKAWQDVADYDVGDFVPFMLSVTLPATMDSYDEYELTFHDNQDASFAMPTKFKVYIQRMNGETAEEFITIAENGAAGYIYTASCTNKEKCEFGGCTFNITVGDIVKIYENAGKEFKDGDKIIVEYESQLLANDATSYGRGGNINGMYVCHPDGHTPIDRVAVLTYKLTINKVDENGDELAGAGFTLYKWIAEENDWVAVSGEVGGEDYKGNVFEWKGLDGGTYKLEETTTPDGYNTMVPMEFLIDSDHVTEWHGDDSALRLHYIGAMATDQSKEIFPDRNADGVEDGNMEGSVENYKGTVLPSTGAEGTFVLVAVGALLVLAASVFMVTRKKMSIYED